MNYNVLYFLLLGGFHVCIYFILTALIDGYAPINVALYVEWISKHFSIRNLLLRHSLRFPISASFLNIIR